MAFPGTLNISYYKGDTYEFRIYPKDSLGASFDLSQYGNAKFTISTSRGTSGVADQIECLAVITSGVSGNYVTCTIRPDDLIDLDASVQYVYDVQIKKSSSPHPYVFTLLTGTLSITDDVSIGTGSGDQGNVKYKVLYIDRFNTLGDMPYDSGLYITGQSASVLSSDLSRPGYTLSGWTTNESTGLPLYGVGNSITFGNSDIVLYSVWAED